MDAVWSHAGHVRCILPAVGLLPPAIREAYGLDWDSRHARALRRLAATARHLPPLLPPTLRNWAAARKALARSRP